MYEPAAAAGVERALEQQGRPLLRGGSSYLNVYSGGADEAHFCASSFGWGPVLRAVNPFTLIFLILLNIFSLFRVGALLVVELVLAVIDCIRGLIAGRDLIRELKFVPARVGICILLRELVTIGAMIDIARGLPIIHLNYLGYDEQAHRRGPSSKFAHWTLKGIDRAIRQVWGAAHRSVGRHYDVWIYSDHGQEATVPYPKKYGKTVEQAVAEIFDETLNHDGRPTAPSHRGIQSQRVRFLGGTTPPKVMPVYRESPQPDTEAGFSAAALGPIGLVYPVQLLSDEGREQIAARLVEDAKIPMVLAAQAGTAIAWTAAGRFVLPDQQDRVLGADHPFLDEVARDLISLCHHPDAGAFVICGWCADGPSYSFPIENGAHAGPGPEETNAFALLPGDAPLAKLDRRFIRPADLRDAAFHVLDRNLPAIALTRDAPAVAQRTLRVMTYNVHSCVGMDGRLSPERIGRVIAQYRPDVVALQELDVGRTRTGGADQAQLIARYLRMEFHFHPALHVEEERYGDAILTHLPLRVVKAAALPRPRVGRMLEPRGALWVAVELNGTEVQIINTHLGLLQGERRIQADALLGPDWLGHEACRDPAILCGDFNALPSGRVWRKLTGRLRDAHDAAPGNERGRTLFGRYPAARIDYVFVGDDIEVVEAQVAKTELARTASDHLPLIVDIKIPEQDANSKSSSIVG
jgi:endonuclease/exonuclease/phosphatase family metal-dependent hydrolase